MNGSRWATAFFITRADFTTCGRNILPAPNRSPTTFMPSISGPSITSSGRVDGLAHFLGVLDHVLVDAVDQRVLQPFAHRQFAPGQRRCRCPVRASALVLFGDLQQALGRVRAAVEHHVLDALAQFGIEVVVDRQRAGVDDAHVHAGLDRVVQEHRVDRLAHGVVAAERERHVGDAAGDVRSAGSASSARARASMKSTA